MRQIDEIIIHRARLIVNQARTVRQWRTSDPQAALTADRNCPPGWRVEIE